MKKIILFIALAVLTLSCGGSDLSVKFERFVDDVEKNHATYTDQQWASVIRQYSTYFIEMVEEIDTLSKAESKEMGEQSDRFLKIMISDGVDGKIVNENMNTEAIRSALDQQKKHLSK